MRVIVTGGSGKLGRACVADLLNHGHEVINIDAVAPRERLCPFVAADLADFGQAFEAIAGVDDRPGLAGVADAAIVHLAAIPAPGLQPNAVIFKTNSAISYNVFEAARRLGIRNIVWASSETVLGLPFDQPPASVPVDENCEPRPNTAYSLGKYLDEQMAGQFCRWDPQLKMVGLRFSNVMEPQDYARFAGFQADAALRKWNLWGYIDARDGAQAVRKALDYQGKGVEIFIIANADTVMERPIAALMAEIFPTVPIKPGTGPHDTLLSIDKARRLLGFAPEYSWRTAPNATNG